MRDPIAPFIAHGLLNVTTATAAAADAATLRAASDARDLDALISTMPLPIFDAAFQARLAHEAAHCIGALDGHATGIEALIRHDGTGSCSYTPIENPLDAITCHLVGVAAEARSYPPALGHYSRGCHDFLAARILIDEYNNAPGRWPLLTCQAASERAVEFVDAHWKQITALALVLGSAGSLTDFEVRLFAGCAR